MHQFKVLKNSDMIAINKNDMNKQKIYVEIARYFTLLYFIKYRDGAKNGAIRFKMKKIHLKFKRIAKNKMYQGRTIFFLVQIYDGILKFKIEMYFCIRI